MFKERKRHSEQVSRVHSEGSQGAHTPSINLTRASAHTSTIIGATQSTGVRGHTTNLPESAQQPPEKPLAGPNQHFILGLPVVHLSLSLANAPWVQLSQRGLPPMAETICQSTKSCQSQERRRSETCYQSETPEQICEIRAFQNGGTSYSQGSLETE